MASTQKMTIVKHIVRKYLEWGFKQMMDKEELSVEDHEEWGEMFIQPITDEWIRTPEYNFFKWAKDEGYGSSIGENDASFLCILINYVNTYFEENFGDECIMDWRKITPEWVFNSYAYVVASENNEEWKEGIIDSYTEETQKYGPVGSLNRLFGIPLSVAFVSDE
jgi:hypothetical protein